jgi:hypothetical protein
MVGKTGEWGEREDFMLRGGKRLDGPLISVTSTYSVESLDSRVAFRVVGVIAGLDGVPVVVVVVGLGSVVMVDWDWDWDERRWGGGVQCSLGDGGGGWLYSRFDS